MGCNFYLAGRHLEEEERLKKRNIAQAIMVEGGMEEDDDEEADADEEDPGDHAAPRKHIKSVRTIGSAISR